MGLVLFTLACSDSGSGTQNGATSSTGGSASGAGGSSGATADAGSGGSTPATNGQGGSVGGGSIGGSSSGGGSSVGGRGGSGGSATHTNGSGGSAGLAGGDAGGSAGAAGAATECVPFEMPADCVAASDGPLPAELRCTGLYADWETRTVHCSVRAYQPAYELWSDGARKSRYVYLPPESSIDVTHPESFEYPAGTQFWKEFWLPGDDPGVVGETRLMQKTAAGWLYTTYVWSDDGSTALQTNTGVVDLHGTGHTVPTREQCRACHEGRGDFILGWDFLMLGAGASGVTLETLIAEGRLNATDDALLPDPVDWLELELPGDEIEQRALGYLHANCGVSCHNPEDKAGASSTGLYFRLDAATLDDVQTTNAVATGVNRVPGPQAELPPGAPGAYYDLRPLDPARSLVAARMNVRTEAAMPRLGTNAVDADGIDAVAAWIESMTVERGYPEAAP